MLTNNLDPDTFCFQVDYTSLKMNLLHFILLRLCMEPDYFILRMHLTTYISQ